MTTERELKARIRALREEIMGLLADLPQNAPPAPHDHDEAYAPASHAHQVMPHDHTGVYAAAAHAHDTSHSHAEYAASGHTHNYAAAGHGHGEYALAVHSHAAPAGTVVMVTPFDAFPSGNRTVGTHPYTVTAGGIPAGVKAVLVRVQASWATAAVGSFLVVQKQGAAAAQVWLRVQSQVNGRLNDNAGLVEVNPANNQIQVVVSGATATAQMQIVGYVT